MHLSRRLTTVCLAAATAALMATPAHPAAAANTPSVYAVSETPALFDDAAGGDANADDPAIWFNAADPDASLVIATAKQGGLRVHDLDGNQIQSIQAPAAPGPENEPGRYNNVDLLSGLKIKGSRTDIAVVSDRGRDRLRIYGIDRHHPDAPLTDLTDPAAPRVFSATEADVDEQQTAYGLATWRNAANGRYYALASERHATGLALMELTATAAGTVTYHRIRTLDLPSSFDIGNGTRWTPCDEPGRTPQVEGMVVDAERGILYAAQEDVGIWRMRADLTGAPHIVDKVREFGISGTYDPVADECTAGADPGVGGKRITADVEGLTIYREGDGEGYLLASSQGDNTFIAYEREGDNDYVGNFRVAPAASGGTDAIDGSEECDGAAVLNAPLGDAYPHGLLVVHDGFNAPDVTGEDGEVRTNTNFKFVDWDDVADALDD
ncbi:phytase [Streptomyces sp. NPDC050256]|uniref:phytase n=1 Tax=Streptomyces sp. NPDC050256 TaxID=3365607 RepID=UPI0037A67E9C